MQEGTVGRPVRRSNEERTRTTRAALVAAARALFVEKGYAATSTPQIATAAHVTRGALYHHFADKQALFRAVVEAEAEAVATEIETAATEAPGAEITATEASGVQAAEARRQLAAGATAYLDAMAVPGRTRLLLVDAPAVLGAAEADDLDARHARRTLREGLEAALRADGPDPVDLDALALLLSAAFDRAALASDDGDGAGRDAVRRAVTELVERVCAPRPAR
ncbi:helix-turn-helix domain-containing protein [Cellulosimicrobium sp. PMB13]|uniref:TetR/AcrR family transcriptional regulator n=1 Tax=Cellulosimicrobium sp. PMB13 TaxID=3120158 RepID=UPI003F4BE732